MDYDQRPEAQDGGGVHDLVLVEAEQVFGVAKQDLDSHFARRRPGAAARSPGT